MVNGNVSIQEIGQLYTQLNETYEENEKQKIIKELEEKITVYSKEITRTGTNKEVETKIKEFREHINLRYNPIMSMCRNVLAFNNEKEMLIRDLRLKYEEVYYRFLKNKKLFTINQKRFSNNNSHSEVNIKREDSSKVKADALNLPLKEDTIETTGRLTINNSEYTN
jgi:hypothetical protein